MTAGNSTVEETPLSIPRPPRFWGSPFGWSFAAAAGVALIGAAMLLLGGVRQPAEPVLTLRGIMASKQVFFNDEEVQRLLLEHHIRVEVTTRGSRELARELIRQDADTYDFAFPSGQPAADLIKDHRRKEGDYQKPTNLFTSPIVLASYREYAETLVRAGVAERHDSGNGKPLYYTLETAKFIKLGEDKKTWNDLDIDAYVNENGGRITNGNRVLAHSSGVCRSNSAGTYLGLVAFVKNGGRPPQTEAEVDQIGQQVQPFITAAGMPESELFQSYVTLEGKSKGPVIVVYEHQYLAYQIARAERTGSPDTNRVLLYPAQEFQSDPEFISLTESRGDRLAELLATDPDLRYRMMELGFRVLDDTDATGTEQLFQYLGDRGIPVPAERSDLTKAELPELDLFERLIVRAGRCPQ